MIKNPQTRHLELSRSVPNSASSFYAAHHNLEFIFIAIFQKKTTEIFAQSVVDYQIHGFFFHLLQWINTLEEIRQIS